MNVRNALLSRLEHWTRFDREWPVRFPWSRNAGPTYYIVRRCLGWGNAGFFSNYVYALTHIAYAKDRGWIPVVDMRNYHTLYSENHPVNGSRNDWEHYFLQPVDTRTAYKSGRFILSDGLDRRKEWNPFTETDSEISLNPCRADELKKNCADYMRIRPEIRESFEFWADEHFKGKKVLGVHWRGTDKRNPPPGHRSFTPIESLLDAILEIKDRRNPDLIFLASDEKGIRKQLEDATRLPIIVTDAFRLDWGDVRGLHTARIRHARKDHRYLLGLEVLRDAWLLSRCDFLVHGHSNVINAALLFRETPFDSRHLVKTYRNRQ